MPPSLNTSFFRQKIKTHQAKIMKNRALIDLDWAGRIIRSDKGGHIQQSLSKIVGRLSLYEHRWQKNQRAMPTLSSSLILSLATILSLGY